jgi:hypothetical protein
LSNLEGKREKGKSFFPEKFEQFSQRFCEMNDLDLEKYLIHFFAQKKSGCTAISKHIGLSPEEILFFLRK